MDVTLAPMRRRHLRAVVQIEEQAQTRPWTSGVFLSELAQGDQRTYLVAKVDGRVVGFGGLLYVLPEAHVTTIAVDGRWRRHGIATRLLLALARAGIAKGADALTLEVRASNTAAQALYRRFGFAPAGIRKGYYPGAAPGPGGASTAEDAVIMWAHDVDGAEYAARLDAIAASIPGSTRVEPAA